MKRRFLYLKLLRVSLLLGALFDLGAAFWLLAAPEVFARHTGLLPAPSAVYSRLLALFLFLLAILYLFAAEDPRRYTAIIVVAVLGRTLGAVILGGAAWRHPSLAGLWPLASADLLLGLSHALFWWPQRR